MFWFVCILILFFNVIDVNMMFNVILFFNVAMNFFFFIHGVSNVWSIAQKQKKIYGFVINVGFECIHG